METVMKYLDLDQLVTQLVEYIPRLATGLFVLIAFWAAYRLSRRPLRVALAHTGLHDQLINLLVGNIYRYSLLAFGLVMALSQLGVNVGAAIAGLGVAGIAVGSGKDPAA